MDSPSSYRWYRVILPSSTLSRSANGPAKDLPVARTVPRFVPAQGLAVAVFAALQRVALHRAAPVAA